jgi:hypothetical protein
MNKLLVAALPLLLVACASSESAEKADPAAPAAEEAPAAASADASECDLARVAARAAWRKQFDRVPDLGPEDRAAMAEEHSMSSDAELGELEATAREAGDDTMLEAIAATRRATDVCGGV